MKLFLSHRIDIYDFSESIYLGLFEDESIKQISLEDIINYPDEIITYNVKHLLTKIRNSYKGKLPIVTDLGQIIKINSGRPKRSYCKGKYPWNFWNRLNKDIGQEEAKKYYYILRQEIDEKIIITALEFISKKIKAYYVDSINLMTGSNQLKRFVELENHVQQILHKRQLEGIHIDTELLNKLVSELEDNSNFLVNKLRYKYDIVDLDYKSLRLFLIKKGFEISSKDFNYFKLVNFLKTTKISSRLCKDIYDTIRVKSDFEKLKQYITEPDNIIYPEFDCIGTITSRILITYPYIQQLKKESRIIFKAKNGFALLYCDYNQFEPGILASFSKDNEMIELYNSDDIYSNFSEFIFGTKDLRKEAKVLFLSYLYGMSNQKLINTIESVIKNKGSFSTPLSASDFFSKFKELENFKSYHSKKAIELGYIEFETTIKRYIKKTKEGHGKKSETRFVLSQLIQGTASFILKKAIIEVSKDTEIEFLIPMHDAVLYQVPFDKIEEKKKFIESCFINSFKSICPEINATVDFKPFEH